MVWFSKPGDTATLKFSSLKPEMYMYVFWCLSSRVIEESVTVVFWTFQSKVLLIKGGFSLYLVVYRFVVHASSRLLISFEVVIYAIICLLFMLICFQLLFMLLWELFIQVSDLLLYCFQISVFRGFFDRRQWFTKPSCYQTMEFLGMTLVSNLMRIHVAYF